MAMSKDPYGDYEDSENEDLDDFEVKFSPENPAKDYQNLVREKLFVNQSPRMYLKRLNKIASAARKTIWELIFEEKEPPQEEQLQKAADFLEAYKLDSCFWGTDDYNNWIVSVKDELVKRNMIDFWKDVVVKKELGPCSIRDSDLEDDDDEDAEFYNYAGCEAPWIMCNLHDSPKMKRPVKKISVETPLEDYKYNIKHLSDTLDASDVTFDVYFHEVRHIIWVLLFGETLLSEENSQKAAQLLEEYRTDACYFNPFAYNKWIPKVKHELLKRKYIDFWQNIIVNKQLGLCSYKDSDYFDSEENPAPDNFYKEKEEMPTQATS